MFYPMRPEGPVTNHHPHQSTPFAISGGERRKIAKFLRRKRKALSAELAERHLKVPVLGDRIRAVVPAETYRRDYLEPLIWLLASGVRSGSADPLLVYSAERARFISRSAEAPEEAAILAKVMESDAAFLADRLAQAGIDDESAQQFRADLQAIHRSIVEPRPDKALKIAYVGDCVFTEIRAFLEPALSTDGLRLVEDHYYFSVSQKEDFDPSEIDAIGRNGRYDLIAMSFLTFDGLPPYQSMIQEAYRRNPDRSTIKDQADYLLSMIDRYVRSVRSKTNTTILLHGCCGLPLTRSRRWLAFAPAMNRLHREIARSLNEGLREIAEGTENVIFIDEWAIARKTGLRALSDTFLPPLMQRRSAFHYTHFGVRFAAEYERIACAYSRLAGAKVLLVDFDNTLWRGVMAEGEVDHDTRAQQLLKTLNDAGILLVALSKNSVETIRWDEMALSPDDFVLHKIGWEQKAASVLDVADELDLDVASFVMLDDSPAERDLVSQAVPGVTVLDSSDPATWDALELMLQFPSTTQTAEAAKRTAMYRQSAQRRQAEARTLDYPTMMRSLQLQLDWRRARRSDLDRLHELANRTNQFNTTTRRYSRSELEVMISDPQMRVFVATLADKFGSLGLVGLVIARVESATLVFENVVMSCRAMGFGLELCLVARAIEDTAGISRAIGLFEATERNSPSADLFARCGFQQASDGEWVLEPVAGVTACPEWFSGSGNGRTKLRDLVSAGALGGEPSSRRLSGPAASGA